MKVLTPIIFTASQIGLVQLLTGINCLDIVLANRGQHEIRDWESPGIYRQDSKVAVQLAIAEHFHRKSQRYQSGDDWIGHQCEG